MHTDTIIKEVHVNVYSLQLLSFITYTAKKAALDTRTVCYIHSIHRTHARTHTAFKKSVCDKEHIIKVVIFISKPLSFFL